MRFYIVRILLLLAVYVISISCEEQQVISNNQVHFTQVDKSNWPIDLSKYLSNVVVRFQYEDDLARSNLFNVIASAKNETNVEIWSNSYLKKSIDLNFINQDFLRNFIEILQKKNNMLGISYKIMIDDLSQAIFETFQEEENSNGDSLEISQDLFFKSYRPLKSIYAWMDLLVQTYPHLISVEWIGQTFEGKDLKAVRISNHNSDITNKKTIVITGGLHAREWISVSSTCYIIYQLLSRYEQSIYGKAKYSKEKYFLDNLDFLILPVMNPDGYEYTWTQDRLWRKNRQETYISRCFGIDIDHSFDYHWTHSDDNPCGEDYSGEAAFESLEAQLWNKYLNDTNKSHNIYGYIDLHSYSQEVLYPYAYSCEQQPRDAENLIELAYGLSKAIRLKSGEHYDVLSACLEKDVDLLPSLGSGSALDYMYHNRAFWAFQIKLRDDGTHGFLLPTKYIQPVGKEIYSAIRYFCTFVLEIGE
ncbi:hypothetical protein PACTADRAFT_79561 [Pachysolen tannophilus NRRL Y-2460]|uniref:Inactive metallocarboxypeptidase ECM14 n=1 Tax=Pachysolen tannophilus NRRL Y-2460 TaxID=669874 RepID=A0A1E4TZH3_PACTA|nr:hypothetical protein PACTADRAFT_79561 [Pachysolen tannophilus NRRL Y-2460]